MQCYRVVGLCFGLALIALGQGHRPPSWRLASIQTGGEDAAVGLGVKAIAPGGSHSVLLMSDGTVWAWGSNSEGQLGRRALTSNPEPAEVEGLSGIVAISAGYAHTLALKSDGTVWAWGRNNEGQLGDGTRTNRATPVQLPGLSGVVAIAAGSLHSLALRGDGNAWAWGGNNSGELGDETTLSRDTPSPVHNLTGATAIAAGQAHSLAVTRNGTVWAWGNNWYGQLGNGTIDPQEWVACAPAEVSGLTGVTSVAAGYGHSMALKADGTLWVWGNDGAFAIVRPTPVQATGLGNIQAIAGGLGTSLAVRDDGTVWEWGLDIDSRSLNSTPMVKSTPLQVNDLTGITTVALPASSSYGLALKGDGSAWVWGGFPENQLGQIAVPRPVPHELGGLSGVAAVSAGMVLTKNGTLWAWDPPFTWGWLDRPSPARVSDLIGVTAIASGTNGHNLALTGGGEVWNVVGSWALFSAPNLTGLIGVAAGEFQGLAVKRDGTVWELSPVNSPAIQAVGLSDVAAVAVAFEWWSGLDEKPRLIRNLALKRDGSVWVWDGAWATRSAPAQISGLNGVTAIAGGEISLALTQDGTVWQWDATSDRPALIQVSGLTGVTAIAIGGAQHSQLSTHAHALALKADGTVWAWGLNRFGQLGDGTTVDRASPVQVTGLSGIVAIGAAGSSSIAVKCDGTVWGWGAGPSRFGTTWSRPVQVFVPSGSASSEVGTLTNAVRE